MKVLFATRTSIDWLASTLWDGLRDLVGAENLFTAAPASFVPFELEGEKPREMGAEIGFDLLVLNSCFLFDHGWDWALGHLGIETRGQSGGRLKASARIAYIEGDDSAAVIRQPLSDADVVFRREIDPEIDYPYACHPLGFAVPERWYDVEPRERWIDAAYLVNGKDVPVRWEILRVLEAMNERFQVVLTPTGNAVPFDRYRDILLHSKLCICPPGAGSDCLRQWEAVAFGAIPVFVGHPPRRREPWFSGDEVYSCDRPDELPGLLERALADDLDERRRRVQHNSLLAHTTRARAQRLLNLSGVAA